MPPIMIKRALININWPGAKKAITTTSSEMNESTVFRNNSTSAYDNMMPGVKFFTKRMKIIENIRKLHANVHIN